MKIITWGPSADASPSQAWIARFQDGKRILPPLVYGPSLREVHAKAQEFWDSEKAKYAKREGRKPATVADAIIERQGKPDPVSPDDDIHMIDGHGPMTTAQVADLEAQFAEPATDDLDDLLA